MASRPSIGQVAAEGGAAAEDDGVEVLAEFFGGPFGVLADVDAGFENDAFLGEQVDAALDDFLLVELHVRNAIHEQAADAVLALEDGDAVAGLVELVGAGESGGAGADDGDFLAGADCGDSRGDPAFLPAACR